MQFLQILQYNLLQYNMHLPEWLVNPPVWLTNDVFTVGKMLAENPDLSVPTLFGVPICINIPAIAIVLLMTAILVKGTKDSAKMVLRLFLKLRLIGCRLICILLRRMVWQGFGLQHF